MSHQPDPSQPFLEIAGLTEEELFSLTPPPEVCAMLTEMLFREGLMDELVQAMKPRAAAGDLDAQRFLGAYAYAVAIRVH